MFYFLVSGHMFCVIGRLRGHLLITDSIGGCYNQQFHLAVTKHTTPLKEEIDLKVERKVPRFPLNHNGPVAAMPSFLA